MNSTEIDRHLLEVGEKLMAFKSSTMREIAVAVVKQLLARQTVFQDEISLPTLVNGDCNAIGATFKRLSNLKLIVRLEGAEDHRRSKRSSRKGGVCWRYTCGNRNLCETFLKRNGENFTPQLSLL